MTGSSRLKDLIMADAVVSEAVAVSAINGTLLPSLLIGRKSSSKWGWDNHGIRTLYKAITSQKCNDTRQ